MRASAWNLYKKLSGKLPILGVCLGHQTIAQSFGGTIIHAKTIMHGKTSMVEADGKHIYTGINKPFNVMRYHSLAVQESGPARLPGSDGQDPGRRNHGNKTQGTSHPGRPVPSGIFHDHRGQAADQKLY